MTKNNERISRNMKKTIVLFHGNLDTLNVFTEQLKIGFEGLGYSVYLFDLNNSAQSLGLFYGYLQQNPILAMIGFNLPFFGLKSKSGTNVWEQLSIPSINILVDHPYWYRNILTNTPTNGAVLCIDQNHMNYISRFYPNIAITGFLPHGGTNTIVKCKKISDRTIDVLYAGSLYADYAAKQQPDFSKWDFDAESICNNAVDYLKENTESTIENALETILNKIGIHLSEEELVNFISSCAYLERIISSYYREKIVGSVAKSGISLTLYGSGWESCEWIHLPNVTYSGIVSPVEILSKMEDTKIVLNTFPWFKNGSHERIYNGMLRGCVIASDSSKYLAETFPNNLWLEIGLSDREIHELPDRLRELLKDNAELQRRSDLGYDIALKKHTWQHRAQEIHEGILQYL